MFKSRFFSQNKSAKAIINKDCYYGRKILSNLNKKISYGAKSNSDYQAKNIKLFKNGAKFDLVCKAGSFPLSIKLVGYHNILNLLAAVASAHSLGIPLLRLLEPVGSLKGAEGRLQEVSKDIFVDYAHTPKGLENILSSLREIGYQRIISVFGCGGQRDKGKRKIMGKVSSRLADFTIITSDNPRKEDPSDICDQIKAGAQNNKFKVVIERREAIKKGLYLYQKLKKSFQKRACLIVAGKGHEEYQVLKAKKVKFKDAQVIKEILENGNY